jgi:hypothetical protein
VAAASPSAGTVEVRDDVGNLIGSTTGTDAVRDALALVTTTRVGDTVPWAISIGAGTYGDFSVAQRNLTIAGDPATGVVISGMGLTDDTTGGCARITRGNVTLDGITCRGATKTGIATAPPNGEGGIVVRNVTVDAAGTDAISATGGAGIVIQDAVITNPKRSGIRLTALTSVGPYAVVGGSVTGAGANGLELDDDVTKLAVTGLSIAGSKGSGVLSNDGGNADLTLQGVTVASGAKDGINFDGGGLRLAVRDSVVTGNAGAGIRLGDGSGFAVSGVTLDGSNGGGDMLFTAADRTGGSFTGLQAGGGFSLPGDPYAVRISAARAGLPASAGGRARSGAALSIAATANTPKRRMVVRFDASGTVWRGAGKWAKVNTSRRIRGGAQAILGTSYLGTATALYAPFG